MSSRGRSIDQEGGQSYSAAALSLVFHPLNPHVPTLRADVRRFEVHCRTGQACKSATPCPCLLASAASRPHVLVSGHLMLIWMKIPGPVLPGSIQQALHLLQAMKPQNKDGLGDLCVSIDTWKLQVEGQAWFGGGADLTPAYLCEEDAKEFHEYWHELCGRHKVCKSSSHNGHII